MLGFYPIAGDVIAGLGEQILQATLFQSTNFFGTHRVKLRLPGTLFSGTNYFGATAKLSLRLHATIFNDPDVFPPATYLGASLYQDPDTFFTGHKLTLVLHATLFTEDDVFHPALIDAGILPVGAGTSRRRRTAARRRAPATRARDRREEAAIAREQAIRDQIVRLEALAADYAAQGIDLDSLGFETEGMREADRQNAVAALMLWD